MAKTPRVVEPAQEYTAAKFRQYTNELRIILESFEEFAAAIEASPRKALAMHNAKGITRGIDGLVSAQRGITDALRRLRLGDPVKPGELKPRSPARSAGYETKVAEQQKPFKK